MDNTNRDKEIINKYINEKMSLSKIGKKYLLSKQRIQQILIKYNIKRRKYTCNYSIKDINNAIKDYNHNDINKIDICKKYNININTLNYFLYRYNKRKIK